MGCRLTAVVSGKFIMVATVVLFTMWSCMHCQLLQLCAVGDEWGSMGLWENDSDRWKLKYSERKPVPVPLCLLHISYRLAWDWTRSSVVSVFN
jgi:hypothetical protein